MSYYDAIKNLIAKATRENNKTEAEKLTELLRINTERGNK